MNDIFDDPALVGRVAALHAKSGAQTPELMAHFRPIFEAGGTFDMEAPATKAFLTTQMVALEADKAAFCHRLCLALGAKRIVEVGTSYGVSTLYLAAALKKLGGGVVIGTEHEPEKCAIARANLEQAGLARFADVREGDLRESLRDIGGPVDFMLVDIWTDMAAPALERVLPALRRGAVVVCDNTETFREAYRDYFALLGAGGFTTQTLPFSGGLELSVKL